MKNEYLIYSQMSQEVKQDWCFLGKILTDMLPVFLHCCILTDRKEKKIVNNRTSEKTFVHPKQTLKFEHLTITFN